MKIVQIVSKIVCIPVLEAVNVQCTIVKNVIKSYNLIFTCRVVAR